MGLYQFNYPVLLTPDNKEGGFVVTSRDLPEAITQGDTLEECLTEAADCLEEAMASRIRCNENIPTPSDRKEGEYPVNIPMQTAMKVALYMAMKDVGISIAELARQLNVDEKEIHRLLDPQYEINLPAMERALAVLGKSPELRVV